SAASPRGSPRPRSNGTRRRSRWRTSRRPTASSAAGIGRVGRSRGFDPRLLNRPCPDLTPRSPRPKVCAGTSPGPGPSRLHADGPGRGRSGNEEAIVSISAPSILGGVSVSAGSNGKAPFVPRPVASFEETGLSHAMIESLVLKFLVNVGTATGRRIASELGLPFGPFPDFLRQLKNQQLVTDANSAAANDYMYSL